MATVNLLPTGDVSNSPAWTLSIGSDVYARLDEDWTGIIGLDISNISATASGKKAQVSFANFTEDHSAINSVTAVTRAGNNGRGQSFELTTKIISGGSTLYTEASGTQLASGTHRTQTYTARTTTDGSTAWDNDDVDDLQMEIHLSTHSGGTTKCTYCYFIIDYDLPVAADNSVFFGTNF